jgi:hypothetical protein
LTANYYDDYDYDNNGSADYTYNASAGLSGQETSAIYSTQGLATGSKVKVLGTTSSFLINAPFFDKYGRPIQLQSNNIMNLSTLADVTTNKYNFSGKLLATKQVHTPGGTLSQITINKTFDYDHA